MRNTTAFVCVIVFGSLLIACADTNNGRDFDYIDSDNTTALTSPDDTFFSSTKQRNIEATEENKPPDDENVENLPTSKLPGRKSERRRGGNKNKGKKSNSESNGESESTTKMPRTAKNRKLAEKDENGNPTCSAPPEIEGVMAPRTDGSDYVVGKSVAYSCHFGFVSRNSINHISTCIFNESTGKAEWTVPEIACIPQSCGDPGIVNNGQRIGNLFTFPNKVEYECDEGYKLKGLKTRFCQAGGEWSGKLPTCEILQCSVPPDPPNGVAKYPSLNYGSELWYACYEGFFLSEDVVRYCTFDGTWSKDEPSCTEARCNDPLVPEHGSVRVSGEKKVGSLATYSCDPGRVLIGMTTVKCLISGQWTFAPPKCLSYCKVPFIENGEMGKFEIREVSRFKSYKEFKKFPPGEDITPRENLIVRCKEGYLPTEDSITFDSNEVEVKCGDGRWSKDLQCKQIPCDTSELNFPGLVKPADHLLESSESFDVQCEEGFLASDSVKKITCIRGKWDVSHNPCFEALQPCRGDPPKMKNGQAVITSRRHGHTIWYKCDNKRDVKVPGKVTCQFGSWVGATPKCLSHPCDTKELDFPGLVKPADDLIATTESFSVQCEEGYAVSNSVKKITCIRGKWDVSVNPCFEVHCYTNQLNYPGLEKPPQDSFRHLEKFHISCEVGFKKITQKGRVTCKNGLWDLTVNDLPCAIDRPDHVEKVTMPQPERTTAEYQPKEIVKPLSLNISSSLHAEECFCTKGYNDNYLIVQTEGRQLNLGDSVKRGQQITLECKDRNSILTWPNGLRLVDKANLTCSTCQKWLRLDHPICRLLKAGQPLIRYDSNMEISSNGVSSIPRGQNFRLVCSSTNYQPYWYFRGDIIADYQTVYPTYLGNGDVLYIALFDILQADDTSNGRYECHIPGSSLPSSFVDLQVAESTCPFFTIEDGLNVSYTNDNKVGSYATFSCPNYAKLVGNGNAVCHLNGSWSSLQPHCEYYLTCTRFPDILGIEVSYSKNVSVGSQASFTCSPPTVLVGSSRAVCQPNGMWNHPPPSCEEPKCSIGDLSVEVPVGVVPVMAGVEEEFMPIGSQVQLECENNLVITGNSVALCGNQGKWELGSSECEMGCHLNLDPSSHLIVQPMKSGYRFGENVLLSCPPGKEMSSDVERLVCLNDWSDAIPTCVESDAGE